MHKKAERNNVCKSSGEVSSLPWDKVTQCQSVKERNRSRKETKTIWKAICHLFYKQAFRNLAKDTVMKSKVILPYTRLCYKTGKDWIWFTVIKNQCIYSRLCPVWEFTSMERSRKGARQIMRHPQCIFPGCALSEICLGVCFLKITDLEAKIRRKQWKYL